MKAPVLPAVLLAADAYGLAIRHSRPVRRAWRLETERGIFALKQAPPPSFASLLDRAEVHLRANGFDRFPRLVLTRAGEPECMLPTGERFILRPWLPGILPCLDLEHPRDLARMARAVAEMHRASKGFFTSHCPESYRAWPTLIKTRMREIGLFLSQTGHGGRFARLYLRAIPYALAEGETALSLAVEADYEGLALEAAILGGRIALLREGRVVQEGMLEELFWRPADPFVTRFLLAQRSPLDGLRSGARTAAPLPPHEGGRA